jgi:hypothetical protein
MLRPYDPVILSGAKNLRLAKARFFARCNQRTAQNDIKQIMPESNLDKRLSELDDELAQSQPTDKTQPIVDELRTRLQPFIESSDSPNAVHYKSLGERLNLALVDLDVDHPRLSAAIRSVLDELAAVGI